MSTEYMRKRVANGLCSVCGKPNDRGKGYYCSKCVSERTEYVKQMREMRIKYGMCPRCGKEKLWGDEKNCPECAAKGYANAMRTRNREHYNEVHKKWSKKAYRECLDNGICPRCMKRKPTNGYKMCSICRSKEARRQREKTEKKPEWKCRFCDEPHIEGMKVCVAHRERLRQMAQHQNRHNSYWQQDNKIIFRKKVAK